MSELNRRELIALLKLLGYEKRRYGRWASMEEVYTHPAGPTVYACWSDLCTVGDPCANKFKSFSEAYKLVMKELRR